MNFIYNLVELQKEGGIRPKEGRPATGWLNKNVSFGLWEIEMTYIVMKNDYIDLCFWVENFQLFCLDKHKLLSLKKIQVQSKDLL